MRTRVLLTAKAVSSSDLPIHIDSVFAYVVLGSSFFIYMSLSRFTYLMELVFYVHIPFEVCLLEFEITQLSRLTSVELWCYFFIALNLHASICLPEFTGLQSRMWLLLIILLIVVAMAAGWFSTSASISINSHAVGRGEEPADPVMEMTDAEAQSLDA